MLLKNRRTSGQVVVLLLIVLAILGGGYWWLASSTKQREKEAEEFARQTATQLALHHDGKFLDRHLAPEAQVQFPPSFRERLLNHLRELGAPSSEIEVAGTVQFTNHFFLPHGQFRAHLQYPNRSADLDLAISIPRSWWQVDYINLTWDLAPVPSPTPVALAPPEESPVPTP